MTQVTVGMHRKIRRGIVKGEDARLIVAICVVNAAAQIVTDIQHCVIHT